ncbi:MAG: S9 family peptidase [Bacteroidales bacterium]|nr:S9 family peptidase [Bacteroidales bacterium]
MKRYLILLLATALGLTNGIYAQRQVLVRVPERNPEGKRITQEAVVDGSLYPHWPDSGIPTLVPRYFSRDGSVYQRTDEGNEVCIARSEEDGIVYGEAVSRNEFGIDGGIFPSPTGRKVAFYRKDERAVSRYPILDIRTRTGEARFVRYPMNGMASERLSLMVYDSVSGGTVCITPTDFDDERYLTGVSWSPDERTLYIQVLSRSQHDLHLNAYSSADGSLRRTVLSEHNDAWVEPLDPIWFWEGRSDRFIYRTDNRDGWRNLYLCDTLGRQLTRLTCCNADVSYLCNRGGYLYYTSAEVSPVENHLFRLPVSISRNGKVRTGKPQRLTSGPAWHEIRVLPDGNGFQDRWSSPSTPGVSAVLDLRGAVTDGLLRADDPLGDYAVCEVELGTVKSADGVTDNYYRLIKPLGWTPEGKYPVIHYVYGGPHSQMVTHAWLGNIRMWEMLMAQRGYVVYVQDNRGTQNRGAAFEKAINRRCGQVEMEDQVAGLTALLREPWADEARVGVYGWSYGGFMAISLLTHYPQIYKAGVAGGPVIDWKWYEVMYGERYMDTPETNPEGFAQTSLIPQAQNLQGRLLLMQGQLDDTVVNLHSLSFVQACVEAGKCPDYFPYPLSAHNVRGPWRAQMNSKITDFFERNLH